MVQTTGKKLALPIHSFLPTMAFPSALDIIVKYTKDNLCFLENKV
jgi:hypothetical protein